MKMFVINCKNYEEVAGGKIVRFAKTAEAISKKYNVNIAVAPPQHLAGLVAGGSITILAQHTDDAKVGSTTGYVVPDLLKRSGIGGSLLNHSEHRIPAEQIKRTVARLKKLQMISIVCVRDVAEAKRYSRLEPDYIAIEPPELIGSGRAVSTEKPELVAEAASAIRSTKNRTKLLCGAGIVSGKDVSRATELGSDGILVASGIVKASNWRRAIEEFAKSLVT